MKKAPLVLLPGLLSNQVVFQHQIKYLSDIADTQVIELSDCDSPVAMTDKILKLSPKRFLLAGHSIGGWIALRLMSIAPEKIIKLCVLNTSARGIDPEEFKLRQSVLARVDNGEFNTIANEIAHQFIWNKTAKQTVLNMFLQTGEHALVNQTKAMMIREDLRPYLPRICCPTLVIHAKNDRRFSLQMLKEVTDLIPHATLKIVPHCGHMSPIERPENITDLMRQWINNL